MLSGSERDERIAQIHKERYELEQRMIALDQELSGLEGQEASDGVDRESDEVREAQQLSIYERLEAQADEIISSNISEVPIELGILKISRAANDQAEAAIAISGVPENKPHIIQPL